MRWGKARLIAWTRITGSIPLLLSAVAVLFLTAMPWTPPARPDRDLGQSVSRQVSVRSTSRSKLGRLCADSTLAWANGGGLGSAPPAILGLVQFPQNDPPSLTLSPWAPCGPSLDLKGTSSSRGPPTA